jgi:CheY-like chemotaxis protein
VKFGEPGDAPDLNVIDFFSDQPSDSTATSEPGNQDLARELQEAQNFAAMLKQQGYAVRIARQENETAKPASGAAYSVLVVEDNPTLSGVVRKALELEGFVARVAANRDEVVAELRKVPSPDLILLDVGLPDVSGLDILKRVRSHPMLKQIPIIMVTALTTREDVIRALAADANGYITKPFEFDALMKSIKAVLGLK